MVRSMVSRLKITTFLDKSQKDINASVSQVVHQLIDLLRDGHPEDRVRGCYHALFLISETYSFPPNTPQLGNFIFSIKFFINQY